MRYLGVLILFMSVASMELPMQASAQVWRSAGAFQTIQSDPLVRALGEATVARKGYSGAMGVNPAGLGRDQTITAGTELSNAVGGGFFRHFRSPWPIRDYMWITSPSVDVKLDRLALGYQYKEFSYGPPPSWEYQESTDISERWYDLSHKIAGAYEVTRTLTVGAAINLIKMNPGGIREGIQQRPNVWSVDLGLIYSHGFETSYADVDASAGWSMLDFGPHVELAGQGKEPLSTMMRGGLAFEARTRQRRLHRPLVGLNLYASLTKKMVRWDCTGLDTCAADEPFEALFTSWKAITVIDGSVNDPNATRRRLSALDQMIKHVGVELSFLEILNLRWGAFREHEYHGARRYDTIGIGIDLYYAALDYSHITSSETALEGATFWKLTAMVPLHSSPDNFWIPLIHRLAN